MITKVRFACIDLLEMPYLAVESEARSQKLAFWNQSNPIMPCDYRRNARRVQAKPIQFPSRHQT